MVFSKRFTLQMLVIAIVLCATPALALDTFMVGPRAMGMGGANVASVDNNTAQYYNPAAFGFFGKMDANGKKFASDNNNLGRKDWGLAINGAGGYRLTNEFGTYLDELAAIDYQALSDNGVQTASDLADLINLVSSISGLDDEGNAVTTSVNGGLNLRIGSFGIGVHSFVQAAGQVLKVDTVNLGFDSAAVGNVATLNSDIVTAEAGDGQQLVITSGSTMEAQLLSAGYNSAAIQSLDYVARQEEIDPATLAEAVNLLSNIANIANGNPVTDPETGLPVTDPDLANNKTTVQLNGFGHIEVPITYGFNFGENFAAGVNFKLMRGRVYGKQVLVFDEDSGGVMDDAEDDFKETTTFGVDLGLMARFQMLNVGLVGRNLNKPEFDGFTKETVLSNGQKVEATYRDVTLDPQVTAGIAFMPFETLTLEVDYDLTKNDTVLTRPGYTYQTQNLSVGLEWDAFRFLALRVGAYQNLAESDAEMNFTGGLGLNLWAVRLDIGGVYSTEEVEYDGDKAPKELQVAGMLSIDF
ncbi:MAG: conjugal transfer protein TraF [Desulfuromonadales bacterium]|nr:conjugal transfer protein TraF [Desulfuromonadales bacterium]